MLAFGSSPTYIVSASAVSGSVVLSMGVEIWINFSVSIHEKDEAFDS